MASAWSLEKDVTDNLFRVWDSVQNVNQDKLNPFLNLTPGKSENYN